MRRQVPRSVLRTIGFWFVVKKVWWVGLKGGACLERDAGALDHVVLLLCRPECAHAAAEVDDSVLDAEDVRIGIYLIRRQHYLYLAVGKLDHGLQPPAGLALQRVLANLGPLRLVVYPGRFVEHVLDGGFGHPLDRCVLVPLPAAVLPHTSQDRQAWT